MRRFAKKMRQKQFILQKPFSFPKECVKMYRETGKKAKSVIKAILFDLDGTLADTIDDLNTAMNRMLGHFGYPLQDRAGILRAINAGARMFVRRSLPNDGEGIDDETFEKLYRYYDRAYADCYLEKTCRYDGMLEAVRELKAMGYPLACLSNKQDEFVKKIVGKLYPGLFDEIVGVLDLPPKPDPAMPLAVCRSLGVDPAECAMIGDSNVDIRTAINAGMLPVGVTWGFRSADVLVEEGVRVLIQKPEELVSFFRTVGDFPPQK